MPETNAARSYAYMSRSHPKDFLTFSGCSVRATNSAHFGATFRKSSAVITVGEFPVRGIIPLDLSPYSAEKLTHGRMVNVDMAELETVRLAGWE